MRILIDTRYEIWYQKENKTVYITPPISVNHFNQIKKILKYYNVDIENIIVGRGGYVRTDKSKYKGIRANESYL